MSGSSDRLDTAGIELDPALTGVVDLLAAHVHDAWVQLRLADGWVYGPARDDARKAHPCLVPFAELTAGDQAYDREIATATLKALVALGFTIAPPDAPALPTD